MPEQNFASRRNERRQLLTSSSAKADDPVFRAAQDFMRDNDYWIPAFAGMTAVLLVGRPLPPGNDSWENPYTRIGIST
jgi:hypothetical protein